MRVIPSGFLQGRSPGQAIVAQWLDLLPRGDTGIGSGRWIAVKNTPLSSPGMVSMK